MGLDLSHFWGRALRPKQLCIFSSPCVLGSQDADACLTVPLVLGVADGVSQIEDFGIDASMLPNELLHIVPRQHLSSSFFWQLTPYPNRFARLGMLIYRYKFK